MSDLKSRLIRCAESWAVAHDCGVTRIGKRVAGDANFFTRLDSPDATCNVATLEKFARFLGDASNWPDGLVPDDVAAFVHVVGVSPAAVPVPTGQIGDLSGDLAAQRVA